MLLPLLVCNLEMVNINMPGARPAFASERMRKGGGVLYTEPLNMLGTMPGLELT